MSATATAKTNGQDFSHDPIIENPIPEPADRLPGTLYGPDNRTLPPSTMTAKAQSWIQQNIVTIALVVITFVSTFAYMKFQIDNVLEKNAELKQVVADNKEEAAKATADAQAYAISARGKADFLTGLLIGKGVVKAEDLNQQK